jgi:hypothetical protein
MIHNLPEHRRGAAMAHLARGSQGIYVFNYFNVPGEMPYLLKEMGSIETLRGKDRSYVVTFVDVNIPGKPIPPALPKALVPAASAAFKLFIGPKPIAGARGEIHVTLAPDKPGEAMSASASINGHAAKPSEKTGPFTFDRDAFRAGYNTIRVSNTGQTTLTVKGVELSVRFGAK